MVKECVHIDTGRYYAAKVINKRLMAGREHMVGALRRILQWNRACSQSARSETRLRCSNECQWAIRTS